MKALPDAPRFFTRQNLTVGATLALEDAVARHMLAALRLKPGAPVRLFNGEGGEYLGEVAHAGRRDVSVAVQQFSDVERESPLPITLALCVSRGDRLDYALQKSTELGVTRIVPLFSERTELRLAGERLEKKRRHWEQVLISACEQCGRNRLPSLEAPLSLADWVARADCALKLVLHHRGDQGLAEGPRPDSVCLLIGPEGGLAETEIEQAMEAGFTPLTLGPRVLRTETAPVASISLLQHLWGDYT